MIWLPAWKGIKLTGLMVEHQASFRLAQSSAFMQATKSYIGNPIEWTYTD